jgi:phosphomannomutase
VTDLDAIFKAYDVRGVYPDQLDETVARRIGAAFGEFVEAPAVVLGRDCRISSPALADAFAEGLMGGGTDVIDIGLATTDMLYFASGVLDRPGAMFTASHNPPGWNGLKLCRAGAAPVGEDSGLPEVRELTARDLSPAESPGRRSTRDMLDPYVDHVVSFVDPGRMETLTVIADAANGMAGLVLPSIFDRLRVKLVGLYMDLDGTFPNHPADPIQPENQEDLRRAVTEHGADVGLAFDGDADRVFLVDDRAEPLSGSTTTSIVATGILEREAGATILHNLICSKAVPEVVRENGGTPVRTRVGHSFIKQVMAETGAAFGGEHSAHYYFRDNYRADSGCIAALVVLERICKAGVPLSELRRPFDRYAASGEINTAVDDPVAVIDRVAATFAETHPGAAQDRLDGLTVDLGDWWFNLRPSNTEPLLRLNLEAPTRPSVGEHVAEVRALITKD